jgi:nucleoporin GLE1
MTSQQWLIDEIAHYIVHSDRVFRAKLDRTTADLERQHRAALEDAQLQHAAILAGAKDALNDARRLHAEELERVRRRNIEAQRREEQERAAAADYERRLAEANAKIRETERLHALRQEELRRAEEEAAARAKEVDEAERRKREVEQRAIESAPAAPAPAPAPAAPAQALVQAVQPVDAPVDPGSPLVRWDLLEQEHNEYLRLHQKLKDMRKHMNLMYKKATASKGRDGVGNPPIQEMANWRRSLQKLLGQLTSEPAKNRQTVRPSPFGCNQD